MSEKHTEKRGRLALLLTCLALAAPADAAGGTDLTSLSLEDLMEIEVFITSRVEDRLFDTPAAVYVLTGEDLRRSGATSTPTSLSIPCPPRRSAVSMSRPAGVSDGSGKGREMTIVKPMDC